MLIVRNSDAAPRTPTLVLLNFSPVAVGIGYTVTSGLAMVAMYRAHCYVRCSIPCVSQHCLVSARHMGD